MFEGDPVMFASRDGGEVKFQSGQPRMDGGLRTAAFLSLWGGNKEDNGLRKNKKIWWGNRDENNESYKYISRFQNLITRIPLLPYNLRRLEETAKADLIWMKTEKIISDISVSGRIAAPKKLELTINYTAQSGLIEQKYEINWTDFSIEEL